MVLVSILMSLPKEASGQPMTSYNIRARRKSRVYFMFQKHCLNILFIFLKKCTVYLLE